MTKYGKSMSDIMNIKESFFNDNDIWLKKNKDSANVYIKQPERVYCKACGEKIGGGTTYLISHNVEYIKCPTCEHINGKYQDTKEYNTYIYIDSDYAETYREESEKYWERAEKIYYPKVDFLIESYGPEIYDCNILDIGAGSGYFVASAKKKNLKITGIEVSKEQCNFGNSMIGEKLLKVIDINDIIKEIEKTNAEILSAIGVFEHLEDMRGVFTAIKNNPNIKFIYCSVPMFSVSVLLEYMNQDCFNRQLGGGHTHLFTNKSIDHLCNEYGLTIKDSWRFGTDVMDFFRMLSVKSYPFRKLFQDIKKADVNMMDDLQLILDKAEISSEKHFLFKKIN